MIENKILSIVENYKEYCEGKDLEPLVVVCVNTATGDLAFLRSPLRIEVKNSDEKA